MTLPLKSSNSKVRLRQRLQAQTGANAPPKETTYAYDVLIPPNGSVPAHHVDWVTLPNGVKTDTWRDAFGRPDVVTTSNGSGDLFIQDFAYFADGQKESVVEKRDPDPSTPATFSEARISWQYDGANRLTEELRESRANGGGAYTAEYKHTYTHGLSGNRLTKTGRTKPGRSQSRSARRLYVGASGNHLVTRVVFSAMISMNGIGSGFGG